MTGKEAKKRLEKQYKRQNEYIKNNYDRISVTFPAKTKDRIKNAQPDSVNGYITRLVLADLDRLEGNKNAGAVNKTGGDPYGQI